MLGNHLTFLGSRGLDIMFSNCVCRVETATANSSQHGLQYIHVNRLRGFWYSPTLRKLQTHTVWDCLRSIRLSRAEYTQTP